jgi:hypothetical protein
MGCIRREGYIIRLVADIPIFFGILVLGCDWGSSQCAGGVWMSAEHSLDICLAEEK